MHYRWADACAWPTVTPHDVLQACLRNKCHSTVPIQYAIKYLDDFDLEAFVKELLDALLSQPYRGVILRKLSVFFSSDPNPWDYSSAESSALDFKKLLSEAVEAQGEPLLSSDESKLLTQWNNASCADFTHAQLPPQEWYRGAKTSAPVIRSLVAYNLDDRNARGVNTTCLPDQTKEEFTPYLSNFTRFGNKYTQLASAAQASVPTEEAEPDQDKSDIGAIEHVTLKETLFYGEDDQENAKIRGVQLDQLKVERRNNLFGPRDRRHEKHIAEVIVDVLGPESKAGR